jgi:hypothetical protein
MQCKPRDSPISSNSTLDTWPMPPPSLHASKPAFQNFRNYAGDSPPRAARGRTNAEEAGVGCTDLATTDLAPLTSKIHPHPPFFLLITNTCPEPERRGKSGDSILLALRGGGHPNPRDMANTANSRTFKKGIETAPTTTMPAERLSGNAVAVAGEILATTRCLLSAPTTTASASSAVHVHRHCGNADESQ